jgi:hypothetical protein
MTPSEAFAAVALVAVGCDNCLSREEARSLRLQLEGRSPYRDFSEEAMGQLFDGLLTRMREDGWRPLLRAAIEALTPAQQETALAMTLFSATASLIRKNRTCSRRWPPCWSCPMSEAR